MADLVRRALHAYGSLGLALQAAIVVGLVLITSGIGVAAVVSIPPDHFSSVRRDPAPWRRIHPVPLVAVLLLKNVFGLVLTALGVVMALPLVPGPGLVFILLGLSLIDFPGKRKAERRLLAVPSVIRFINEVRARFGRAPLTLDAADGGPEGPRRV